MKHWVSAIIGINMNSLKNRFFVLAVIFSLAFLASCSTGQHKTIISSYSQTEKNYEVVGYRTEWLIWPLLELDNKISIKVHPAAWKSLTSSTENCSSNLSTFYVTLWSSRATSIDMGNTFFVSKSGEKVTFELVRDLNKNEVLYSKKSNSNRYIGINKSDISKDKLRKLWFNSDYKEIQKSHGRYHLEFTTKDIVGCATDFYQLNLSFINEFTGKEDKYVLYFYPVEYKSFSK